MIDPVVLWSVVGLLILATAVSLVIAWRLRMFSRALALSRDWIPVDARIAEVRIEHLGQGEGISFLPVVSYDYNVAGRRYRSESMSIGPPRTYSFRRGAERAAGRFGVGASLAAWVDPADLRYAVLERRAPFATGLVVCLVVLWVVTLGGIALLLFAPGVVGPGPALRL